MKPTTLRRLQTVIEDAAQDLVLEHHAELDRAWQQAQREREAGHEYGRAYLQGIREERRRLANLIQREMRTVNRGSLAHKRLLHLLAQLEPADG